MEDKKIEEQDIDLENNEVEAVESEEDTTDWQAKAKEAEAEASKWRRIAERSKKKEESPKEEIETTIPSNDLGEKAYLIANGIKDADEIALTKKLSKETGKNIESLLATTYFQTELSDFREKKASDNATVKGGKRNNNSSVDTVEYWIAKGELPPASEVQLRRDVVNARIKKEETRGVFYNQ